MLQVSKLLQQETNYGSGSRGSVVIGGVTCTEMQARFIDRILAGAEPSTAAELSGFTDPHNAAYRLTRLPKIQQAIQSELHRLATIQGAPLAYGRIMQLIESEATPPGIALKASQWMLETAGIRPQTAAGGEDGHGKPLEDMTLAELEAIAQQARKRLETIPAIEGQARTIEPGSQQQKPHKSAEAANSATEETPRDSETYMLD
jgi:hypothetical protein